MNRNVGSRKLTRQLHSTSSGLLPLRTRTSQSGANQYQLPDICTYSSFYQQLIDLSPSRDCSPTDSCSSMPPVSKIDYSGSVFTPSASPLHSTSAEISPTVQTTATSQPCLSKTISDKPSPPSAQVNQELVNDYQLSNFTIEIEQMPDIWTINAVNGRPRPAQRDAPINPPSKSPQYRPRHSYLSSSEIKYPTTTNSKLVSENHSTRSPEVSREHCRSPVFTRRPTKFDQFACDPSLQPIVLLSSETNERLLSGSHLNRIRHTSTITNSNKRTFDSSTPEQILIKRRYQKFPAKTVIQRDYCRAYPSNIARCVDCQINNQLDSSLYSAGCRFQHCRILKHLHADKCEIEGFTTIDKATPDDTEVLLIPNSGGQPPLNHPSANHVFIQIAKFFYLMFSYEETERKVHDEKKIIWKRYMAGWREVCDDCSTTLFNYHYMCQICGYMICIECFHQFSQLNAEKRKKLKSICAHETSYRLSEFIPWKILIKLRDQCMQYFAQLKIDYSMELYPSVRNENLSIFIKSLKMKRDLDQNDTQRVWSTMDCNFDPKIEFYCDGRLPVFKEWMSASAKDFFQKVWSASCPVLVKQVHQNLSKTLWHPRSFKSHMIDHHETPALWDCETLIPIPTDETILTQFWDGFECLNVRLKENGRPRILKLKDWPTKKDFASVFPSRLHDLMSNIPFGEYTRRSYTYSGIRYHGGAYNIVERLPACLVKPDLGPKLYIAYSQLTSQSSRKAGTTNLHIDVSDAVNVLVYVGVGSHGTHGTDKEEEIRQVEAEIAKSNIDKAQLQRLRNGERPGALWHLFRSDDVKKIREYLGRTHRKIAGTDSIHDQNAYLEQEDLVNLKESFNVESYPVLQFLGDAVFIPSGAPHQVKNLHSCIKIAEDFVSPENLDRCLITANEFRTLSKTHTNHADILQAKNILYYATRDALDSLANSPST